MVQNILVSLCKHFQTAQILRAIQKKLLKFCKCKWDESVPYCSVDCWKSSLSPLLRYSRSIFEPNDWWTWSSWKAGVTVLQVIGEWDLPSWGSRRSRRRFTRLSHAAATGCLWLPTQSRFWEGSMSSRRFLMRIFASTWTWLVANMVSKTFFFLYFVYFLIFPRKIVHSLIVLKFW